LAEYGATPQRKRENHIFDGRKRFQKTGVIANGSRVARFFLVQNTKTAKNIPNYHEPYQMSV
jgi:hypothetical protein